MNEGWLGDEYLVLFGEDEACSATKRYRAGKTLPGYAVIGLRGWDDFIVRDAQGDMHTVPTVPLEPQYVTPYVLPDHPSLEPDSRFVGKIKWYVKPLVFGGDPNAEGNTAWVTHEQHGELVVWWNTKYKELKASGGGA
jgi:hypothetical protein